MQTIFILVVPECAWNAQSSFQRQEEVLFTYRDLCNWHSYPSVISSVICTRSENCEDKQYFPYSFHYIIELVNIRTFTLNRKDDNDNGIFQISIYIKCVFFWFISRHFSVMKEIYTIEHYILVNLNRWLFFDIIGMQLFLCQVNASCKKALSLFVAFNSYLNVFANCTFLKTVYSFLLREKEMTQDDKWHYFYPKQMKFQ